MGRNRKQLSRSLEKKKFWWSDGKGAGREGVLIGMRNEELGMHLGQMHLFPLVSESLQRRLSRK
jgi:hypothetical protein